MLKSKEKSFNSVFCINYWKKASRDLNNIKVICIISLIVALHVVISSLYIPVGENLRIYFSFIPMSIASAIGGPIFSIIYGFLVDILGCIIHPSGPYFPGYTLNSMLAALIFSLFLYRTKITVFKIVISKLTINVIVNIGLGTLWSSIIFNKGYYYFFVKSMVKNILILPIEIILLVGVFKVIIPLLKKMDIIHNDNLI